MMKLVRESMQDILKPKEGALKELNKWSVKNLMKPPDGPFEEEATDEWLRNNQNLAKALKYDGIKDVKNIVGFDLETALEEFPGGSKLFSNIIEKEPIHFYELIHQDRSGGLKLHLGRMKDGTKIIFYKGGMIDGYIARREWIKNRVSENESMGNILQPKNAERIVNDVSQEVVLDLLNGAVSFFEPIRAEPNRKWYVSTPVSNIKEAFDRYYEEFGPGYYVMAQAITTENEYPGKNVFPNSRWVAPGTIQYNILQSQGEDLIKELVALVMTGKLGRGFHINYYKPDEKT